MAETPFPRIGALLIVAAVTASCQGDGSTGMMLELTTSCAIPQEIDTLRVRVWNAAGMEVPRDMRFPLTAPSGPPDGQGWPIGRLGLAADEPPPVGPITVEATGLRGDGVVVSRRVTPSFVKGTVRTLTIFLDRRCAHRPPCPSGEAGTACLMTDPPGCVPPAGGDDASGGPVIPTTGGRSADGAAMNPGGPPDGGVDAPVGAGAVPPGGSDGGSRRDAGTSGTTRDAAPVEPPHPGSPPPPPP